MTKRGVAIGSSALIAAVAIYFGVGKALPDGSFASVIVSDVGFLVVEVAALALCVLAFLRNRGREDRWIWIGIGAWVALNLLGDSAWAYYELGPRGEVPFPGLADVGYLSSYAVAFVTVMVAAWKACGRLRATETALDAMMITGGVAGLGWPLILGPLLESSESGAGYWVNLSYIVGDLLIVLGFVIFFLASSGPGRRRPPVYLAVMCFAFLCRSAADSAYFMTVELGEEHGPGSWMGAVWLLTFALAGSAALVSMRPGREPHTATSTDTASAIRSRRPGGFEWSYLRIVIPYVALGILLATMLPRLYRSDWQFGVQERVLFYMGLSMVALLICRQYLILVQNRRLNLGLARTSGELEDRVGDLAALNKRLEALNDGAHRLNSLRTVPEIADAALEWACSFEQSPGGWISLTGTGGERSIAAMRGSVDQSLIEEPGFGSFDVALGLLRTAPLEIRGENLGTLCPTHAREGRSQARSDVRDRRSRRHRYRQRAEV